MTGQIGVGALGYFGYALEAVRGVPAAAINDFLMVTTNTMNATPDVIRRNVFAGSRSAERIIRTSKFKIHGGIGHPLYGNSGAQLAMAAMGQDTYLSPISGTASAISSSLGMSIFTTTAVLTPGALVQFGSGATAELRSVHPTGTTNQYIVKGLNSTNSAGTPTISQISQHKFSPIPPTNPLVYTLPTLTIEMNEGGQWAWQMAGVHVGKYTIKGGKEDVDISETLMGTVMPVKLPFGAFTSFTPTTSELADAGRPFTINDGYIIVPTTTTPGDPSTMQVYVPAAIEDWEYDWDNGLIEKAFWDGSQVYKTYPGLQKSTVKYKYAIDSGRPDAYEDFLVQLKSTPVPFIATVALNIGVPATPEWNAMSIYTPSTIITKADIARSITDVTTMNIEADALITQAGADITSVFVANATATAYVGS